MHVLSRARSDSPLWRRRTVGLAVLLVLTAARAAPARRTGVVLFTTAEAEQLRVDEDEWRPARRSRSGGVAAGPRILIKSPPLKESGDGPVIETTTPTNLAIAFQANGVPVDMTSLEVTAHKGFFSKSLTDLLKPYVRGTTLQVADVTIPEGRFLIEIAIADQAGARTVETYRLDVQDRKHGSAAYGQPMETRARRHQCGLPDVGFTGRCRPSMDQPSFPGQILHVRAGRDCDPGRLHSIL